MNSLILLALEFGSEGESDQEENLIHSLQDIISTGELPEWMENEEKSEEDQKLQAECKSVETQGKSRSEILSAENPPELHSVFIGNLEVTVSKKDVLEFVEKIAPADGIRILMPAQNESGKKRAVAFVDFSSASVASNIVKQLNGKIFQGKNLQVKLAKERKMAPKEKVETSIVFVRNLAYSTTEESIRNLFSKFGKIVSIRLPIFEDSKKHRGFCFVEFSNDSSAKRALEMDRKTIDDRKILVELSSNQELNKSEEKSKKNEHVVFRA